MQREVVSRESLVGDIEEIAQRLSELRSYL